ncbi:MAG: UDP-glucose 4-epimerase GalE [Bacteroides sp.]|nr:UDP-glucose 4-epimerase GalE [Bacteroides sp.]
MAGKVIVTGGLGFIGSHTVVELQQKGYEVVIADNLSNSSLEVADRISRITGETPEVEVLDLSDRAACLSFFKLHSDAEAVIHFAASKAVGESVQKPLLYYRNNLDSLLYVIEGMQQGGCRKLVYSSSCTVYGQPKVLPVTEQTPRLEAECPYGNTKRISEDILTDLTRGEQPADGRPFRILALRYFNPIGAHPSALIGELPNGVPGNLMPYITQTAAGIRPCLQVFGNDYATPDGTPIRDYIYVCDLAQAHVCAMEYLDRDGSEGIDFLNLGTGRGYSVLEIIQSFERSTGMKLNYKVVGRRAGDIEQIWADTAKAERLLGWKAKADIDQMTLSAWKWQQSLAPAR